MVSWFGERVPRKRDISTSHYKLAEVGGERVVQVASGLWHSAAVTDKGSLWTFGLSGVDYIDRYGSLAASPLVHSSGCLGHLRVKVCVVSILPSPCDRRSCTPPDGVERGVLRRISLCERCVHSLSKLASVV